MQLRQHRGQRVGRVLHVDDQPREPRRESDQLRHLRRAGGRPEAEQREAGSLQLRQGLGCGSSLERLLERVPPGRR
eukprot:scaffold86453_cov57-Phaeocystis_antarctica.AAC.2